MEELRRGYLVDHDDTTVKMRIPEYYFDLAQQYAPELYERIKLMRYDFAAAASDGWFSVGSADGPTAVPGNEFFSKLGIDCEDNFMLSLGRMDEESKKRTQILRERARVQDAALSTLMRRLHHV